MLTNLFITIFAGLLVAIATPYILKRIEQQNTLFRNKFFYSLEAVNQMARKHNFSHCEKSKYLKDTVLAEYYADSFTSSTVDEDGKRKILQLPYEEEIDFIKTPAATISIASMVVNKKYTLPRHLEEATQELLDTFNAERKCTDDPHPRMSSFTQVGENQYECTIEEATYYQQIRTNLTLDYPITIKGIDGDSTLRAYDHSASKRLTDLSSSYLSNAIGVSAIWMMGKPGNRQVFLLPRKKRVGVFETKMGIPSGNVEMPANNTFSTSSLVDFLKLDIAREFAEETGLCGKNIDISKFSKPVPKPTMIEHMEIIPLAFVRELLRGGKPQMFFLILTPDVPVCKLKRSFRKSLGTEEFDDSLLTSATPSSETMCNYLYAQKYLQKNRNTSFIAI